MVAAAGGVADACGGGAGVAEVAVAALDVLVVDAGFFAVVAALDAVETVVVATLVGAAVATVLVTLSSCCTSLYTSPPEEASSLSAVGRGVLGVTVKDGTSGGSSARQAAKFCSFGERCSGEGGLASGVALASSSSLSTKLSTSLCE